MCREVKKTDRKENSQPRYSRGRQWTCIKGFPPVVDIMLYPRAEFGVLDHRVSIGIACACACACAYCCTAEMAPEHLSWHLIWPIKPANRIFTYHIYLTWVCINVGDVSNNERISDKFSKISNDCSFGTGIRSTPYITLSNAAPPRPATLSKGASLEFHEINNVCDIIDS